MKTIRMAIRLPQTLSMKVLGLKTFLNDDDKKSNNIWYVLRKNTADSHNFICKTSRVLSKLDEDINSYITSWENNQKWVGVDTTIEKF